MQCTSNIQPPRGNHCWEHRFPSLHMDRQDSLTTGSNARKVCTTFAAPATTSAGPCHASNLLGFVKFRGSVDLTSLPPPGLPAQGMLRHRCLDL
eukprot:354884-Chlamydomonas_euryale.AAC.5